MWNRKELKTKAKGAVKRNRWLCVLVSLAVALPMLVSSYISTKAVKNNIDVEGIVQSLTGDVLENPEVEELIDYLNSMDEEAFSQFCAENDINSQEDLEEWITEQLMQMSIMEDPEAYIMNVLASVVPAIKVSLKSSGVSLVVEILVFSVIEVGACIFFIRNSRENAQANCLFDGFKSERYGTIVVAKLLVRLYEFLWGLLFLIPGLIKHYEYYMIPYILADHPEIDRKEAFARSKQMMQGNKWKTFVLELSFIGWYILNGLTANLLNILWIAPFKNQTGAELYLALKGDEQPLRVETVGDYDFPQESVGSYDIVD